MNEVEEKAIENLKKLQKTKPYIIWGDSQTPYNKSNTIQTILDIIQKQTKMIDEMAYEIASVDDDLCAYIDSTTRNNECKADIDCNKCIKEYFERKVKNNKKNKK